MLHARWPPADERKPRATQAVVLPTSNQNPSRCLEGVQDSAGRPRHSSTRQRQAKPLAAGWPSNTSSWPQTGRMCFPCAQHTLTATCTRRREHRRRTSAWPLTCLWRRRRNELGAPRLRPTLPRAAPTATRGGAGRCRGRVEPGQAAAAPSRVQCPSRCFLSSSCLHRAWAARTGYSSSRSRSSGRRSASSSSRGRLTNTPSSMRRRRGAPRRA